jgi:sensor histidine kinase regulating citrate/malate metabolism
MKQPITTLCVLIAALAIGGIFAPHSNGQQPSEATQEAIEIARLIGEIEQQQTQFTANQDAMEKRMTAITEELRLARIHATRGGGAGK